LSRDLNHHRNRHARPEFPTPTACQPPQTPRSDRWTPDFAGALWDPRRREALERLWDAFSSAGAGETSLSDELISERRAEAEAEDRRVSLR